MAVVFGRVTIVGTGLIGGSLAKDLRRLELCDEIVGAGRSEATLARARELGVIDRYDTDIAAAVAGADLVVVAVPLGAMTAVLQSMRGALDADTVITDVGSAKRSVISAAREAFGELPARFVPGHPIAGTEKSGVEAALDGLFERHRVILTPMAVTDPRAVEQVRGLWRAVGAEVLEMDADQHDEVLAATSHLPHMLAYTLVDVLGRMEEREEIFRYAAGGFRDFTRIASSDPQMWHDICFANRDALLRAVERFHEDLARAIDAIRQGDGMALKSLFERAKRLRDRFARESEVV